MSTERPIVDFAPSLRRGGNTATRIAAVIDVDVPAAAYVRGCKSPALSHGTLLDEAIRFLNFGTGQQREHARRDQLPPGETKAVETVVRNHAPLPADGAQLKGVISTIAHVLTPAFYEHVRRLYDYDGMHEGLCSKGELKRLVRFPAGVNPHYIDRLSAKGEKGLFHDKYQLSLLLPRLICDTWATDTARARVFDYSAVEAAHAHVRALIAEAVPTHPEVIASRYAGDLKVPFQGLAMLMAPGRVGAARTVVPAGDRAGFLLNFAEAAEVGLTEKVLSTLTTLSLQAGPLEAVREPPGRAGSVATLARIMRTELDKLVAPPQPQTARKGKGLPPPELPTSTWIRSLLWLQSNVVLPLLTRIDAFIPAPNVRALAIGDLLWALILVDYLVLWLLHLEVVTLLASTPFRQIYEGGLMLPLLVTGESAQEPESKKQPKQRKNRKARDKGKLDPLATVDGIMGAAGVAFWEYLGGDDSPHVHHASARNSFSPQIDRSQWYPDSAAQARTLDVSSKLSFDDRLPANLEGAQSAEAIAFFEHLGQTTVRYVDRIAAANRIPLPRQSSRQSTADWRKTIDRAIDAAVASAGGQTVAVRGPFPIGPDVHPRFHDSIYNGLGLILFDGWGGPSSSMGFGAKLECHLQAYVFAWLCRKWFSENQMAFADSANNRVELADRLIFTCASAQYGGKFPPHITHRDGYGFDFSLSLLLQGRSYHWSTHWPQDTTVVGGGNRKTFGEHLLVGGTVPVPLGRAATMLRRQLKSLGKAAQPILDELGRDQIRFTIREGLPEGGRRVSVGTTSISKVVPREALVSTWDDTEYAPNRPDARPPHRARGYKPVFREFLREYTAELGRVIEKELVPAVDLRARNVTEQIANLDATFTALESSIDDWPIMPDRRSHLSHHFAHLALVLSFPREIIWGAPLYHLRAMNAVLAEFAKLGLPNPFVEAAGATVGSDYAAVMTEAAKTGKMPVPQFLFLPHNHHHHWHVNFWAPQDGNGKSQEDLHLGHIRAAMPYWRLLGVDLEPFLLYLKNMKEDLQSARGEREMLTARIDALTGVIEAVPAAIVDQALATRVRRCIFSAVVERWLPSSRENTWMTRTEWPRRGSPLSTFTECTLKVGELMRSFAQRFEGTAGNPTREEISDWLAQLRHDEDEAARDKAVRALISGDELEELADGERLETTPLEEGAPQLDANQEPLYAD